MQTLFQDIRFGARVLLRSPGMTLAVILALALGIGANTAMFSVVDALILHPLRYQNPSELVVVWDRDPQGQIRGSSSGNFLDWRKAKSFSALAGWAPSTYTLTGLDQPVADLRRAGHGGIFQDARRETGSGPDVPAGRGRPGWRPPPVRASARWR